MRLLISFVLLVASEHLLAWYTHNLWLSAGIPSAIYLAYWGRLAWSEWKHINQSG